MTLKTIDSFISTVDPHKTTVVSFPEFIALFGGDIRLKKSRSKPKSKRDAFYWWISEHRKDIKKLLLLPESYEEWSNFAIYSDLLLFEKDLGYLTSAVLVFLESYGSIAELGAFSQIPSLSERLMVVVNDTHHPKKSFISLGPIRSIQESQNNEHCVCEIPDVKPNQLITHIGVIVDMLDKKRVRTDATEGYRKTDPQHEILLVLDLVNLFLVILKTELLQLASHFGTNMKMARLDQILFLLDKTELISSRHYGGTQYFFPLKFKKIYVDYTSNEDSPPFKRTTLKARVSQDIERDRNRKIVYDLIIEESGTK